ncbi:MAG: hypothetical protein VX694_14025 [Planctomycetota bacterium]|nr:hypothetical protein [Planctomycetota bacterium]
MNRKSSKTNLSDFVTLLFNELTNRYSGASRPALVKEQSGKVNSTLMAGDRQGPDIDVRKSSESKGLH